MVSQKITLESVKMEVDQFRIPFSSISPLPDALWEKIIYLTDHYPILDICRALRVTRFMIRHHKRKLNKNPYINFIDLRDEAAEQEYEKEATSTELSIQITKSSGDSMTINAPDSQQLSKLVLAFLGETCFS